VIRTFIRRPSAAMVVAVIALSVAMSASAVALPGSDTGSTAKRVSDVAPEAYREVGSDGNPVFLNGCSNVGGVYETAAFFRDRQGIVHLKGAVTCPGTSQTAFQLPPGYRPADNKVHVELSIVQGAADGDGQVFVTGHEGAVAAPNPDRASSRVM
jgi:hypothetical protein